MRTVPQNPVLRCVFLMVQRYLRHRVAMQSAALSFYLLFTLFPLMIFFSALLGVLQLNVEGILQALANVLPNEVVDLAEMYLVHVSENSSFRLLWFGLVFSVYFPMRATNRLMRAVRMAYRLGQPRSVVVHWIKVLGYTVLLMLAITATLALMTVGDRMLNYGMVHLHLPVLLADLWTMLRFPVVALLGFFALIFLYALAQDWRQPWRNLWPGTLLALVGWVALSWGYSFYVNHFAHYSALYGSIGAIIVLLVWLQLCSVILIMGAEFNGVLISMRKDRQ